MKRILLILTICISALICLSAASYAEEGCDHNWSDWEITDTDGCTSYLTRVCLNENCDAIEEDVVVEHMWTDWQTDWDATCSEVGHKSRYCDNCGAYEEETIPATGKHQWDSWFTLTGATIYRAGVKTHYCMSCGAEQRGTIARLTPFAKFTQSKYSVYKGSTMQMKSVLGIASGDAIKSWKTSKKKVVSITKAGKIKAKKKGTAKITVTLKSGKKATCTIKVTKKPKASKKSSASGTVYITRTGVRYHCDKNCWGLRNANALYKVTLSTAKKKGLTPCHVCY